MKLHLFKEFAFNLLGLIQKNNLKLLRKKCFEGYLLGILGTLKQYKNILWKVFKYESKSSYVPLKGVMQKYLCATRKYHVIVSMYYK